MTAGALVTVAIPVYNGAKELPASLSLIRNQTYDNLEIIISDNASTDETPDICATAARKDARIRYFRQASNLGPTPNFNHALSLKRGDFFMWAADDDEKAPTYIEKTVAALLRNRDASMACTWATLVMTTGERVHRPYSSGIASSRVAERVEAFVADTQCFTFYGLYRASVVDAIGPIDPWLDADRRYLFKAILRGPFEVVPETLFRFQMANTLDDYIKMGFKMRPGAADFDLDLYRHFPELMRAAALDDETIRETTAAMRRRLRPYLDNRAGYLISRALHDEKPRREKLRSLFAWGRQYPPMMRSRMFWGALRRLLL